MTQGDVVRLDEAQKKELREVRATEGRQQHFSRFKWDAAPGAMPAGERDSEAKNKANVYEQLPALADPIPEPDDWIRGIPHHSSNPSASGENWSVLRSMHSRKMHYFAKLRTVLEPRPPVQKLLRCFPDLSPASGGQQPLSEENKDRLIAAFGMKSEMDYIKHILTLHDGEVRLVGEDRWDPYPASGGDIAKACFWPYQCCKKVVASNQDIHRRVKNT